MQSRAHSILETCTNVAVGYAIAVTMTWYLIGAGWAQSARWSVWYTLASLVRGYVLRRIFTRTTESPVRSANEQR